MELPAAPRIDSVAPDAFVAGTEIRSIHLAGEGFQEGMRVTVSSPSSEFSLGSEPDSVQILDASRAVVVLDDPRPAGAWSLRVANPDGGVSNSMGFRVEEPPEPPPEPPPVAPPPSRPGEPAPAPAAPPKRGLSLTSAFVVAAVLAVTVVLWSSMGKQESKPGVVPPVTSAPVAPPGQGFKPPTTPVVTPPVPPPSTPPQTLPASVSTPDIRIGDRWVLQTTDHLNPQWSNSTERLVTAVSSSGITMTSRNTRSNYTRTLTYTPEWNLVSEREPSGKGADYSPPMRYLDFPLETGRTWNAEVRKRFSDGRPERVYRLSGEVQGQERVQVRAGSFDAVRVMLRIETLENGALLSRATDVSWFAAAAKRSVKTEETSEDLQTGQQSRRSIELVEYSVSR
ncbi:MAG: hypothetical protein HY778_14570 [Betaproteobacteria bacterium]|nr:hypothetical protein [Betaproteobacteria bacterium]